jgi:transcription initiation factor TFIIIB Brf1 subunit/transcription initiation factor TFIIB
MISKPEENCCECGGKLIKSSSGEFVCTTCGLVHDLIADNLKGYFSSTPVFETKEQRRNEYAIWRKEAHKIKERDKDKVIGEKEIEDRELGKWIEKQNPNRLGSRLFIYDVDLGTGVSKEETLVLQRLRKRRH